MVKRHKTLDEVIAQRTSYAGKTFTYNNDHDPTRPVDHWFHDTVDGKSLFVVCYTQACRWASCLSCNLPSRESEFPIPFYHIMAQVDYLFTQVVTPEQCRQLSKIILSNNGSVLDEATFSTTALLYFVAKMNIFCPNVRVLSIETRPEYVDFAELEVLARALRERENKCVLELAVGFEAWDDYVRNEVIRKGLHLPVFESMVKKVSRFGYRLKVYFMIKPVPDMSDEDAMKDVEAGVAYLSTLAERFHVDINVHLNPTYVARGTLLEQAFHKGTYHPPRLSDIRNLLRRLPQSPLTYYVGLYDEGMAVEGGSFIRPGDEEILDQLQRFNLSGDVTCLK